MKGVIRAVIPLMALVLLTGPGLRAQGSRTLDDVLAEMVRVGSSLQTMQAQVERDEVNGLLGTHLISSGRIYFEPSGAESRIRMNLTEPAPQQLLVTGGRAQLFNARTLQLDEYDLGERSDVAEYLVVGFGPGNADLAANFDIELGGEEQLDGRPVSVLTLRPISEEVLRRVQSIRLWVDQERWVPLQQRLNTGGNHLIVSYSDITINEEIPDGTWELDLPDGVKR